jgi:hypothetical protein
VVAAAAAAAVVALAESLLVTVMECLLSELAVRVLACSAAATCCSIASKLNTLVSSQKHGARVFTVVSRSKIINMSNDPAPLLLAGLLAGKTAARFQIYLLIEVHY